MSINEDWELVLVQDDWEKLGIQHYQVNQPLSTTLTYTHNPD